MTAARYHHGNLAETLVAAALALIEAEGLAALNLRELARRSGVSATAVYRHFDDKDQLLAAVAAEGFARLGAAFDAALATHATAPPLDRLRALGAAYVDFALAHPSLYRLMFGSSPADPARSLRLREEGSRAFARLAAAAAACCSPGAAPPAVTAAAVAAWSLVHGYALLRLDGQLDWLPTESQPDPGAVLARLLP